MQELLAQHLKAYQAVIADDVQRGKAVDFTGMQNAFSRINEKMNERYENLESATPEQYETYYDRLYDQFSTWLEKRHPDVKQAMEQAVPPEMDRMLDDHLRVHQDLAHGYADIERAAKDGRPVTGADFIAVQDKFNRADQVMNDSQEQLPDAVTDAAYEWDRVLGKNRGTYEIYQDHLHDRINGWLKQQPQEVQDSLSKASGIEAAFHKQYVDVAPVRKNTALDPATATTEQLLTDLLSKNPGIAVGDVHTQDETIRLLSDHMAALKKAGVDTIYVERPPGDFVQEMQLSKAEMESLISDRKCHDILLAAPDEVAKSYGTHQANDVDAEYVKLMLAARENGIRLVNIDKDRPNSSIIDPRVGSTNFTWTDTVKADREKLEQAGKTNGKYVVFAGMNHLADMMGENGMVDDALGLPVVAFTQGEKGAHFRKNNLPGAPDFSIPGGADYPDTDKHAALGAARRAVDAAEEPLGKLPGVKPVADALRNLIGEWEDKAYNDASEMPDGDKVTPRPTPALPPAASRDKSPG